MSHKVDGAVRLSEIQGAGVDRAPQEGPVQRPGVAMPSHWTVASQDPKTDSKQELVARGLAACLLGVELPLSERGVG